MKYLVKMTMLAAVTVLMSGCALLKGASCTVHQIDGGKGTAVVCSKRF